VLRDGSCSGTFPLTESKLECSRGYSSFPATRRCVEKQPQFLLLLSRSFRVLSCLSIDFSVCRINTIGLLNIQYSKMMRSARATSALRVPLSAARPRAVRTLFTRSTPLSNTTSAQQVLRAESKSTLSRAFYMSQRSLHATASNMAETRAETDAFGEVQVAADRYWGAQTQRSIENFRINQPQDRMPPPIVKAFGILKGAAATVNMQYGLGTT
jgi:hypothetical protein